MQDELGLSHAAAGLLATIPVLCMGLFALPGARLATRWGTRRSIGGCLALIAGAGLLRAAAPGTALLLAATAGIGIGMGACGALLPVAVKERFATRPGLGTGAYATGIQVGAVASSVAVVLLAVQSGWRLPLVILSLSAAIVCVGWLVLDDEGGSTPPPAATAADLGGVVRDPGTWSLVAAFALMGMVYYGLVAWLPDAYEERGWSPAAAGGLVAALSFAQVPGALAGAWLGDRVADRRALLFAAALVLAVGSAGVAALPAAAYLWAGLAGLGMGVLFTVILTFPLDLGALPTQAGAIAGVMLTGGYTAAALAPVVLGAVRDVSGSFSAVLFAVAGGAVVLAGTCRLIPVRSTGG